MITNFETLLSVGSTHSYYEGPSADLEFVIPEDSVRVLGGGRMLSRILPDVRLYVAFEADESGSQRVTSDGKVLRLGLRLVNPYFSNFTDLTEQPLGSIRLYRNVPDPTKLGPPSATTLVGNIFSHTISRSARPVTVTAAREGRALRSETVSAEAQPSVAFDVTGIDPGSLAIEEVYPGAVKRSADYYLDAGLRSEGVFGIVEIAIEAGFYAQPATFDLTFAAKKQTLKYYVVATNYSNAEFAQLSVMDVGFGEQERPEVKFTKVPESDFGSDDKPPAILTRGGGSVVMFRSQTPVARSVTARRRIELRRNLDALIANLPQPSSANATSDLVVYLSKPKRM
jgi:hypothetical protein